MIPVLWTAPDSSRTSSTRRKAPWRRFGGSSTSVWRWPPSPEPRSPSGRSGTERRPGQPQALVFRKLSHRGSVKEALLRDSEGCR